MKPLNLNLLCQFSGNSILSKRYSLYPKNEFQWRFLESMLWYAMQHRNRGKIVENQWILSMLSICSSRRWVHVAFEQRLRINEMPYISVVRKCFHMIYTVARRIRWIALQYNHQRVISNILWTLQQPNAIFDWILQPEKFEKKNVSYLALELRFKNRWHLIMVLFLFDLFHIDCGI